MANEAAAMAQQDVPPEPGSDGDYSDHGQADGNGDGEDRPVASNSPRPPPVPVAPVERKVKLNLRGSHGEAKLAAKLTHTASKLLNHYGKKHNLSAEVIKTLRLEDPDGELIEPDTLVADMEVEDDDLLNVKVC